MRRPLRRLGAVIAVAAVLGLATSSCATRQTGGMRVAEAAEALRRSVVCCTELSGAPRLPLPLTPTSVDIGKTSASFEFAGRKAFFVLYELPAYATPYSIFVTSQAVGTIDDVALFIPRIALYDADFKQTRYFDESSLRNRGNDVERTVFVNPSNRGDRYLAIYGADLSASIHRDYSQVTTQTIAAAGLFLTLHNGVDGKSTLRTSPGGTLQIETSGLSPAPK